MPVGTPHRRQLLRESTRSREVDVLLITRGVNVTYLSGLVSSNAGLLIDGSDGGDGGDSRDGDVLVTDGRYAQVARSSAADLTLQVDRDVLGALARSAAARGARRVGVEDHHLTMAEHAALRTVLPGVEIVPLGLAVEQLRIVKDEHECAALATACAITDAALEELFAAVAPGVTERELAHTLERRFVELGADAAAFPSIVAAGEHSAVPHHVPTDRPVQVGDLLTVDCGARFAGYCADTTRTVVLGRPAAWQADLHALVLRAADVGLAAVVEGADAPGVDATVRAVIAEAGHGEHFVHGLGHGVGLEVHEAPMLTPSGTGRLRGRTPVTVEPGIYLPGRGGVRIEDTVLVRPAGLGPEHLTKTTRDLLVLG